MNKMDKGQNSLIITEVMEICDELGVKINPNMPTEKNKFLSAWHKRSTEVDSEN